MAKDKKSFLLYTDLIHTLEKMSNEKAGELFKHIMRYVNDLDPKTDDLIIDLTFEPIKQQLKRDLKNYENRCLVNKNNGSKGGRPKNQTEPAKTDGLFSEPKKPDNDIDIDIDNGNVNENKEEPPKGGEVKKSFVPNFDSYPTPYRQGLKDWWGYKVEKKQKYTQMGWDALVEKALKMNAAKFSELVKNSMANNWAGLHEPKTSDKTPAQETKRRGNDTFDY